ncbi:MAG: alpha/beta hydrolase [Cellulophaga sp.]|nr:alpha/beta hydrolase [Cellulophaga sp.]
MKTFKILFTIVLFSSFMTLNAQQAAFKVEVIGKGEPVLLFPGFTCTGEVWSNIVAELSKTKECHIFIFAGFGDVPAIEKPWLPKIKESVVTYISANKLDKPTLIGHSLGGTLALWMASENDVYDKIIVIDGLPSTGALMMPNFNSEYIVYDNPYNTQLLNMDDISFEKMAVQMAVGMTLNTSKRELIKNWILKTDRETYVYGYTDLLKLDLRTAVANIKAPVTILGATEPYGLETVKKTFQEQYQKLEDYTIKFADESAHFIMFDKPDWLLNEIKSVFE